MMAILDPVKVVIDNYPEGQIEYLDVVNNLENEELGSRKVPFGREIYIDREDSTINSNCRKWSLVGALNAADNTFSNTSSVTFLSEKSRIVLLFSRT